MFSSSSSTPSHRPYVGEPLAQVDVDVDDPSARAAHELGDARADVEVHAPHDAPAEREWLSWTNSSSAGIPASACHSRR